MRKRNFFILSLLVVMFLTTTAASGGIFVQDVPIPDNAKINKENPSDFVGFWGVGRWDNTLNHILIVEDVNSNGDVKAFYAWGKAPEWDINQNGYVRIGEAHIKNGALIGTLYNGGVKVRYTMDNDTLRGSYSWQNGTVHVTLPRMEDPRP